MGLNDLLEVVNVLDHTANDVNTDSADVSRLQNGTQAIGELVNNVILTDEYIEFIYFYVPYLPFGEPSNRFKLGLVGATVRLNSNYVCL